MPLKEPRFNQLHLDMSPPSMQPWKMSPPSMSPLHMTPPNMLLPNFEVPAFKLPTLTLSKYFPPPSQFDEYLTHPPSAAMFAKWDPTMLVVGTYPQGTKASPMNPTAAANEGPAKLMLFRIRDEQRDVFGDIFPPDKPNQKLVPDLKMVHSIDTKAAVVAIQWSPHDPEVFLATLANGSILLVSARMGRKPRLEILSTHILKSANGQIPLSISFSPKDDGNVAFSYSDGTVIIASLPDQDEEEEDDSLEEIQAFKPHSGDPMLSCVYSADGKKLYVSDSKGAVSSWFVRRKNGLKLEWVDTNIHDDEDGVTSMVVWPSHDSANFKQARRLLLTGSLDGMMRVLDLGDDQFPPPVKQELDMFYITDDNPDGGIWRLDMLPPLPRINALEDLEVGVFSSYEKPDVEVDYNEVGIVVSGLEGGSRIMVQRPEFSEVHLPELDEEGKPIFKEEDKSRTGDGVEKDWYGREKSMEWYNVIEFSEHEGKTFACAATAFVDWDTIFKEENKQNKRRGWRIVSTSFEDRKLAIYHIYVD